jgi:hypothetical protein
VLGDPITHLFSSFVVFHSFLITAGSSSITLMKLFLFQIFGPLTKLFPKFVHKISVMKGDASLPDLGLSPADRATIIEKVDLQTSPGSCC